jgi:MinD superfamily P-loop ATPase
VALVRQQARQLAEERGIDLIITDGPPGVGCPVIASVGGATSVLIVTEPTVSGIHDMARAIELCQHFKVPVMVCINKFDLNPDNCATIERMARDGGLPVVGRVPFDQAFHPGHGTGKDADGIRRQRFGRRASSTGLDKHHAYTGHDGRIINRTITKEKE